MPSMRRETGFQTPSRWTNRGVPSGECRSGWRRANSASSASAVTAIVFSPPPERGADRFGSPRPPRASGSSIRRARPAGSPCSPSARSESEARADGVALRSPASDSLPRTDRPDSPAPERKGRGSGGLPCGLSICRPRLRRHASKSQFVRKTGTVYFAPSKLSWPASFPSALSARYRATGLSRTACLCSGVN